MPRKTYTLFWNSFLQFLTHIGVEPEVFHPQRLEDEKYEELRGAFGSQNIPIHISRAQIMALIDNKPSRLTQSMAERWAWRGTIFLQRAIEQHRAEGSLSDFEVMLPKFSFVRARGHTWVVCLDALIRLYARSKNRETATGSMTEAGREQRAHQLLGRIRYELLIKGPRESLSSDKVLEAITKLVEQPSFVAEIEGCTTIVIEVSPEQAEKIDAAIATPGFRIPGLIGIRQVPSPTGIAKMLESSPVPIDALSPTAREEFSAFWRRAAFREELIRPWRRLRYLLDPDVRSSPLGPVISESRERAYAWPGLLGRIRSLGIDLRMTLVLWPLMTALLIGLGLRALGSAYPHVAIEAGIITGLALALFGSQPCSILVSPLACGGGTVLMGAAFGIAQGVILGRFGESTLFTRDAVQSDFLLSVTGGLVGLSAPVWRSGTGSGLRLPNSLILLLVISIAVSIALAGWLMGQPERARGSGGNQGMRREVSGGLMGFLAGAGIGLVFGLSKLLQLGMAQERAVIVAFAIVGGLFVGGSTYLRIGRVGKAAGAGILHGVAGVALLSATFLTAGTAVGLVLLAAACGYFQSTFFTAAFVIGFSRGGARGALIATTLEGALGFAGFVVARIFHLV